MTIRRALKGHRLSGDSAEKLSLATGGEVSIESLVLGTPAPFRKSA